MIFLYYLSESFVAEEKGRHRCSCLLGRSLRGGRRKCFQSGMHYTLFSLPDKFLFQISPMTGCIRRKGGEESNNPNSI